MLAGPVRVHPADVPDDVRTQAALRRAAFFCPGTRSGCGAIKFLAAIIKRTGGAPPISRLSPGIRKMHYVRKQLDEIEQQKGHQRSEAAWAIAAVTLIGLLMCAVIIAVYPIWS